MLNYLSVIGLTYLTIQLVYLLNGLTYPIVKTMDYFNFIPAVILALTMDLLIVGRKVISKLVITVIFTTFSGMFIVASIPVKEEIFSFYHVNVVQSPPLTSFNYLVSGEIDVVGISPTMRGFPLELFYYVNRFRPFPLKVYMADEVGSWASYRYLQDRRLSVVISHKFCLGAKWNTSEIQRGCSNLPESELILVSQQGVR
jgi:hypothetical protein